MDDPRAARCWAADTLQAVRKLTEFLLIGRVVPEFEREDIRELVHARNYRIVYRVKEGLVEIITIAHASQLLADLIDDESL